MKGRREKYRARAIRHVGKALENAFNLSINIQRAGLYTPSLKRDASLFIYHKDTWLTASCKQVACLYMCMRMCGCSLQLPQAFMTVIC